MARRGHAVPGHLGSGQPDEFAYWRPDDGVVWASYMHEGYVHTADRTRGVDVLRLTGGAAVCLLAGTVVRGNGAGRASLGERPGVAIPMQIAICPHRADRRPV